PGPILQLGPIKTYWAASKSRLTRADGCTYVEAGTVQRPRMIFRVIFLNFLIQSTAVRFLNSAIILHADLIHTKHPQPLNTGLTSQHYVATPCDSLQSTKVFRVSYLPQLFAQQCRSSMTKH